MILNLFSTKGEVRKKITFKKKNKVEMLRKNFLCYQHQLQPAPSESIQDAFQIGWLPFLYSLPARWPLRPPSLVSERQSASPIKPHRDHGRAHVCS